MGKNLNAICPCPKTLQEAEPINYKLVYLSEVISKQQSIQAVAWVLLAVFS
jgi:hypothetical protein